MTMIQHYIKHISKVGLSTDKFNKWLKKPYLNTSPPRGNQSADWDYTSLAFTRRAPGTNHIRGQWVHLKHKLRKHEYKVVLSKTYVGAILLMHMYQGKERWGSNAEVPALTWLVLNYEYQTWCKKRTRVHISKYTKQ